MAQAATFDATLRPAFAGGWISRVRKTLADHRQYRVTVEELNMLSDRELSDLGIHRTMIPAIAREAVYGA